MRQPCGWYENGEECGKPLSQMGVGPDAWYLCAEHEDEVMRGAKALAELEPESALEQLIEESNDPGREDSR